MTVIQNTHTSTFRVMLVVKFVGAVLLSTLMTAVLFTVGALWLGPVLTPEQMADGGASIAPLLGMCVTFATVLLLLAGTSAQSGWRLAVYLSVVFYGVNTFMSQIESVYFAESLNIIGRENQTRLFLMTLPVAVFIGPFIAWLTAAMHLKLVPAGRFRVRRAGFRQWIPVTAVLILFLYPALYFVFGYYVAWQSPAVLAHYQGTDPGSFLLQMQHIAQSDPALYGFQVFRGALWVALIVWIVRCSDQGRIATAFMTGLVLAALLNIGLIMPNPYMPEAVRYVHLLETATSTFIWGVLAAWLLFPLLRSANKAT